MYWPIREIDPNSPFAGSDKTRLIPLVPVDGVTEPEFFVAHMFAAKGVGVTCPAEPVTQCESPIG